MGVIKNLEQQIALTRTLDELNLSDK